MKNAFIFDIDGVITDPKTKKIKNTKILDILLDILKDQMLVLNTGRSLVWTKERVLDPLLKKIKNEKLLANLFIIGEFGSVSFEYDNEGKLHRSKDSSIFFDRKLAEDVERIVSEEFSDSMMFDQTKETMISTEMNDGFSIEKYRKIQKNLIWTLKELLSRRHLEDKLEIHADTIAANILDKKVGKDFAIRKILNWIDTKKFKINEFMAFGDSQSDLEMGKELVKRKRKVRFVFVGNTELNKEKYEFPIIISEKKFDEGTLEFLKSSQFL